MTSPLADDVKRRIQSAYSNWLDGNGFRARYGQRLMIADIARTLARAGQDEPDGEPIAVVEAGTGTGKTIAYTVAALPLAQAMDKTLVIATATVALQEQIVQKDLPDLVERGGLDFSFALAKGRGRYLCLAKLDGVLRQADVQPGLALYPDEADPLHGPDLQVVEMMLAKVGEGGWDGDRDSWPEGVDNRLWSTLSTDHHQCSGARCEFIAQCPFYRARNELERVDCIVANHDLVLSDLGLGGGVVLPAPEDAVYVFDEAHHLPDKARQHFSRQLRLDQFENWLEQGEQVLAAIAARLPLETELQARIEAALPRLIEVRDRYAAASAPLRELAAADGRRTDGEAWTLRLPGGEVPAALRAQLQPLAQAAAGLRDALRRVEDGVQAVADAGGLSNEGDAQQVFGAAGQQLSRFEAAAALWRAWSEADPPDSAPAARWLRGRRDDGAYLSLNASPILAAEVLREQLWSRCHAAVLTSATLTALGRFDRLRMHAGLPESCHYSVVPSPFRYEEMACLQIPRLASDPGDPAAHTADVAAWLNAHVDVAEATLVLFASRRQLRDVAEALHGELRERLLTQDEYSKQELLRRHRAAVDAGRGSVIFGLASLSEGIDLPGRYCDHVVIAKIPFAVPDEPIEEALAEWVERQGGNAFMQISVPDAALRLVQASGRLLRSEQDRGRITLLDRRIVSRRYGRAMLDSLPPFRRDVA